MTLRDIALFFNINYPFNEESLKLGYNKKKQNIEQNNIILLNEYEYKYNLGLVLLNSSFNPRLNFINNLSINPSINSFGKSYSYISETINGNQRVLESETIKTKDKIDTIKKAYSIDNKGNKKILNYDKEIDKQLNYNEIKNKYKKLKTKRYLL